MLEKIDKILEWKVTKNIFLGLLVIIPNAVIASKYNISSIHLFIMNLSYFFSLESFRIAFKNIKKKESYKLSFFSFSYSFNFSSLCFNTVSIFFGASFIALKYSSNNFFII